MSSQNNPGSRGHWSIRGMGTERWGVVVSEVLKMGYAPINDFKLGLKSLPRGVMVNEDAHQGDKGGAAKDCKK